MIPLYVYTLGNFYFGLYLRLMSSALCLYGFLVEGHIINYYSRYVLVSRMILGVLGPVKSWLASTEIV